MDMTRWKAAGIHFSISLVIAIAAIGAIVYFYSPPLLKLANAYLLIGMIIGIDVILGPLLTLLVYKAGKRSLKFDLSVIACLQLSALVYGLYTAYQARPTTVIAMVDRFELVHAFEEADIDPARLAKAKEKCVYRTPYPQCWVGYRMFNDPLGLTPRDLVLDERLDVQSYVALADLQQDLFARTKTLPGETELRALPISSKHESQIAVMSKAAVLPVRFIDADPWALKK
jgi:hypothetical protein